MLTPLGSLVGRVSDIPLYRGLAVGCSMLLFGVIEFAIHELVKKIEMPPVSASVIDGTLVGVSFGLAVWVLLLSNCERRTLVREELERIAELNHEIRNALQVISHAHFDADSEHRHLVMESVSRIDTVLRRVYPVVGGARRKIAQ